MSSKKKNPKDYTGHEVVIVREFAAPRETVFEAWTDPKQLAQWWGPRGFTNPVCEWAAEPGRAIHVVMRAPNGEDYPMGGAFREVVPPERLVFTSGPLNQKKEMIFELLHTVTFAEHKDKTTVTVHARVLWTTTEAAQYLGGYEAGMTQSLERLADLVSPTPVSTAGREIISTRVFNAPRELIWEAWTNPEHLIHWWGPNGFTNTFHEFNCKPGGVWRYVMHGPDGRDYKNEVVFVELVKPKHIILDHVSSPRFRVTATFEAHGEKTKIIFHQVFQTVAEYEGIKKYAIPGNEQNFDRLAAHLKEMPKGTHPTLSNGKVCYIQIPAEDVKQSAAFYTAVFGWKVRKRDDGSLAFDDGVGEVSGTWVTGRKPASEPGLLVYIMVDSIIAAVDAVTANGGKIVQPIGMDAPELTARFSDPAGNIFGLYQQPPERR